METGPLSILTAGLAPQPITVTDTQLINANNTTAHLPIFGVTGSVNVLALWGVVTTALGANHTAAYWRLNDQTAQVNITLNTGTTLSAIAAGSLLTKIGLAAAALSKVDNAAGRVNEPTTLETPYFSPFEATKKLNATTNIEYNYTTTDTPTSGVIQFYATYIAISADGALSPL